MLLKRKYDGNGKVVGVQIRHTGTHALQNFPTKTVLEGLGGGWITIEGDTLTVHAEQEALEYTILRAPGYYCCHDGQPIPVSDLAQQEVRFTGVGKLAAAEARAWLASHGHAGKPSPDPAWPSGYAVLNHYECVLNDEQHVKYKAVPGALAPSQRVEG